MIAWLAIRLLGLRSLIGKALGWLTASSTHLLCAALALSLAWGFYGHHRAGKLATALHSSELALKAERAGRLADRKSYTDAQIAAQKAEDARLVRVNADTERNSDHALQGYREKLADLRARYERMRVQGTANAGSQAGSGQMSELPDPAFGTVEAPGDQGFSLAERYTASQQAEQLDALISWVEGQAAIDVN